MARWLEPDPRSPSSCHSVVMVIVVMVVTSTLVTVVPLQRMGDRVKVLVTGASGLLGRQVRGGRICRNFITFV